MIYDLEKNKVYVKGIEFDGPTLMKDIEVVLLRIQEAIEAKKVRKDEEERKAKKAKKNSDGENGSGSSSSTVRV